MRAASPCSRHPNTAVHTTRACSCYAWVVPPASGYARRIASPESTQPPMTHVTGTGTFFGHSTQRSIAGCAHLGFQRRGRVKHSPRFIGTAVASADLARAFSQSRFGVDKDGSWLGRTARTRGANDGQRGVGGFVLSPQPKRPPFRADGLQSPQSITTKENILELLMIPDSEVGLRDGGLVTIGGALNLLERGRCNGGADRSGANRNCEMLRGMTASTPVNCMVGRVPAVRSLPL
jgi:hypothetical protein